jgi:hypothetical protein
MAIGFKFAHREPQRKKQTLPSLRQGYIKAEWRATELSFSVVLRVFSVVLCGHSEFSSRDATGIQQQEKIRFK